MEVSQAPANSLWLLAGPLQYLTCCSSHCHCCPTAPSHQLLAVLRMQPWSSYKQFCTPRNEATNQTIFFEWEPDLTEEETPHLGPITMYCSHTPCTLSRSGSPLRCCNQMTCKPVMHLLYAGSMPHMSTQERSQAKQHSTCGHTRSGCQHHAAHNSSTSTASRPRAAPHQAAEGRPLWCSKSTSTLTSGHGAAAAAAVARLLPAGERLWLGSHWWGWQQQQQGWQQQKLGWGGGGGGGVGVAEKCV